MAGRSRIKTTIFTVLAAHAALLLGLLIQGCKEDAPAAAGTPPPAKTNASAGTPLPAAALPVTAAQPVPLTAPAATLPSPPKTSGSVYVVKPGDTLSRIAHEHATTAKAIQTANGLSRDQLRVGQKLVLPATAS